MKEEIKKFLEFNGKTIFFIAVDGQYYIAIKPICRALNVDYIQQFKNLKNDQILLPVLCKHTMQVPGDQLRNYVCLPEFYIYGWIFQIQSQSPELLKYKWECYRVLYQYFHGAITGRKELLSEKAKAQMEINQCLNTMDAEVALKLEKANKRLAQINRQLREADMEIIEEEKTLFDI